MAEDQGLKDGDTIVSLRTQIIANAVELFPNIVVQHHTYLMTGIVKADQIFGIIDTEYSLYNADWSIKEGSAHQAILTYGPLGSRRVAARSSGGDTTEEALRSFLQVTAALISEAEDWLFESYSGISHGTWAEICQGRVDATLLPTMLRENVERGINLAIKPLRKS